jgi:hypothetical protein
MEKIKKVPVVEVGAANNQECINDMRMSAGNVSSKGYPAPKTSGIKVRGTGAATKGTMARGPMA